MKTIKDFWTVLSSDVSETKPKNEDVVLEFELKNPFASLFQADREVRGGRLIPA